MTPLCIVLIVLTSLVTLIWFSRHLMIRRERRTGFVLDENYPIAGDLPPLHIFVAAKDEEANIATCLRGLLAQDYPDLRVTVIDDRSADRTGEIARGIAAEDRRVSVMRIESLPEGWMGKSHAMHRAIAAAGGDWLLMTDADCEFTSPRCLSTAMSYALATGSDLLSVLPLLKTASTWEHIIQPVCGGVMMIWFHPDKVNDPARPNAYANGAFMLMKRSAYEAVGTHEAIRDRANEDMHLAAMVKQAGLRLRVVRNDGLYAVRMYTGFLQIVRGWTRIFYGTFVTFRRILVSMIVMVMVSLWPWLMLATGVSGGLLAGGCWWILAAAAAGAAVVQMTVIWRFFGILKTPRALCITYPIGSFIVLAILANAMGKLRRGARLVWRSTSYTRGTGSGVR